MEFFYVLTSIVFLILLGYLPGSIPFGLLITKFSGLGDIRNIGSGNIGATNVLRTGNKSLALITLFLDGLKGAFGIFLIIWFSYAIASPGETISISAMPLLVMGLCAVLGHMFPVWLKFKGGKGVATALGALLAAVPLTGLAVCAAWVISAALFRISSLAAIVALGISPIVTLIIYGAAAAGVNAVIAALVIARHHANIQRLLKGEEPKIGTNKA